MIILDVNSNRVLSFAWEVLSAGGAERVATLACGQQQVQPGTSRPSAPVVAHKCTKPSICANLTLC